MTEHRSRGRGARVPVGGAMVAAVLVAALAPEPVILGGLRLGAYATIVTGVSLLVARVGAADLSVAALVAVGAYAGGVAPTLAGLPVALGLPSGMLAGALVGGLAGTVHGRLGRTLGALASLAVGTAVVAAAAAWPAGGGVAGFHAVALPTPWGARADLVAVVLVLGAALLVAVRVGRTRTAALAALSVRAPQVVLATGHRPALATGRIGMVAGAVCALGGVSLAAVTGSVLPGAFDLQLAAALALAALVGGAAPWGPLLGTTVVWGPSTLWPLVPLVGTAPPLLVAGPLGLALLALRRGRALVSRLPDDRARPVVSGTDGPPSPRQEVSLRIRDLELLGRRLTLTVEPGEIVALSGPNGVGKSTVLAMVGGQLGDGGAVELAGRPAPRGPRARARRGVARTWQRAPDLPERDVHGVVTGPEARRAADWAHRVLAASAAVDPPHARQLVLLAAARPGLALIDEPTGIEPPQLAAFVRGLADGGTGVLLVDHRPEILALADRVVRLASE